MIGHREWQSRDDHVRKRFAWNIDTAPKTVRAEKDAARRSFELFEQFSARRAAALDEQIHFLRHEKFLHLAGHLLHVAVARKQNEGATASSCHKQRYPMLKLLLITGVARVRHFLHNEQLHLFLKIKRAAELQGLGLSPADATTKISQVCAADRQRRAGHDAAAIFPENHAPQDRRKIDRCGVEGKKLSGLTRALHPVNMLPRALLEKDCDPVARVTNSPTKFLQFS